MFAGMNGASFDSETAERLSEALERLDEGGIDVVLLDLALPDSEGVDTFLVVHGQAAEMPVVVMTGPEDKTAGRKAIQKGAYGHLIKDKIDKNKLEKSIRYAAVRSRYKRDKSVAIAQQEFEVADLGSNRHLFILYQVARAINFCDTVPALLDQTMSLVFEAVNAKRGAVFLYNDKDDLELGASHTREESDKIDVAVMSDISRRAIDANNAIICTDSCYDAGLKENGFVDISEISSVLAVPLWERDRIMGAIYLDNPAEKNAFNEDDMDLLTSVGTQLAMRIRQDQMQAQMQENAVTRAGLERFHSPDVASLIFKQSKLGEGFRKFLKEREVTILFADISDFTPLLERLDMEEAADLMNDYLDEMTEIIFKYKGNVDKFIGDAIMATFGAPISYGNDAELAVFAAIEMMKKMEDFKAGIKPKKRFDIRIGINTGMVISGYLGSKTRIEYTVLGDPVNIAARLQHIAPAKKILVGEETYARVRGVFDFKDLGSKYLKGKTKKTGIYEVAV